MNTNLVLSSFLAGVALVVGCYPTAEESAGQASETAAQQLHIAHAATDDTPRVMRDYAFAEKNEFVADMQAKLSSLNRSLDVFSARVESSGDSVKEESRPKLDALRTLARRLHEQIEAAEGATPTTWNGLKADAGKTYTAMKAGFAQARQ